MSAVETLRDALYGNPPSPTKKPSREGVLAAFTELNTQIYLLATVTLTAGGVVYATQSTLNADLAHAAGVAGLVWNDADATKNGLYVKIGASGSGSWVATNLFEDGPALEARIVDQLTAMVDAEVADLESEIAGKASAAQGAKADSAVQTVAGKPGPDVTLAKADVGLSNVDNTSDADKPVSTAQGTALAGKATAAQGELADSAVQPGADISLLAETAAAKIMTAAERVKLAGVQAGAQVNAVQSVAGRTGAVVLGKTDVGLPAVDNTSDVNKPVSTAMQAALDGKAPLSLVVQTQGRPGDALARFAAVLTGEAAAASPPVGAIVVNDEGASVLKVVGATVTGVRERFFLDPSRVYRARLAARRTVDPTDPAGDTIRYAIQWLNKNKAYLTPRIIEDLTQTTGNARVERSVVIAAAPGDGIDFVWPNTARYMVPYVQTFGLDGETTIEVIEMEDITDLRNTAAGLQALGEAEAMAREAISAALDDLATTVALRFFEEAQARQFITAGAPDNMNTLAKIATALLGDPLFGVHYTENLANEAAAREAISAALDALAAIVSDLVAAVARLPPPDPPRYDAGGSLITVPAGSMKVGERLISWLETDLGIDATADVAVTNEAIAAGAGSVTALAYETIVSVQRVRKTSNGQVMTNPQDYTIDQSRGFVTNVNGTAMLIDYTGSPHRKDILHIDVQTPGAVPTVTAGAPRPRTAELWADTIPAGHMEIGRVTRYTGHAFAIFNWKYRNGVHVDRLAEYQEALSRNRQILSPIIARLAQSLPVRVIAYGNSRPSMGMFGDPAKLNTNPNSHASSDPTNNWSRDAYGFFELYDAETQARVGADLASRVSFDTTVGYNLPPGTPDGFGAVHLRQGFTWEMLKALHKMYPSAIIDYRNWGIAGSDTSNTANNGLGNARYPQRLNAVLADIIPGQTVFIPPDPMNELGSKESYANWVAIARAAQEAGAVVHFMGNSRADPRFNPDIDAAAFSAQEMVRAAWATGSAISDGFRLVSPENLPGLGLTEFEIASATLRNHEGPPIFVPLGQDPARSYAL